MKTTLWRVALWGLLGGALLACARTPAATDPPRAALESAIQRWVAAVNAGDEAALAATMTEDVELADGTAIATGRSAAIRALRESTARGKLVVTTREIVLSGDEARHTAGLARIRDGVLQPSGEARDSWKRVNGAWQLHRWTVSGAEPDVSLTRPSTKEPVLDRPQN
jgi:ketosteroid isomerase-like protein